MLNKDEVRFEIAKGQGPGGQHRNKTFSTVKAIHIETGIHVTVDGRDQHKNKRDALKLLEARIKEHKASIAAAKKKARRDTAIKETETIRTYDFKRRQVLDHRTGKTADLKQVLDKGRIDLLR